MSDQESKAAPIELTGTVTPYEEVPAPVRAWASNPASGISHPASREWRRQEVDAPGFDGTAPTATAFKGRRRGPVGPLNDYVTMVEPVQLQRLPAGPSPGIVYYAGEEPETGAVYWLAVTPAG